MIPLHPSLVTLAAGAHRPRTSIVAHACYPRIALRALGVQAGACVCVCVLERKQRMPISAGLAVGEHAITVQWCERDPSAADDRKLTFVYDPMAQVTVITPARSASSLAGPTSPRCSPHLSE